MVGGRGLLEVEEVAGWRLPLQTQPGTGALRTRTITLPGFIVSLSRWLKHLRCAKRQAGGGGAGTSGAAAWRLSFAALGSSLRSKLPRSHRTHQVLSGGAKRRPRELQAMYSEPRRWRSSSSSASLGATNPPMDAPGRSNGSDGERMCHLDS